MPSIFESGTPLTLARISSLDNALFALVLVFLSLCLDAGASCCPLLFSVLTGDDFFVSCAPCFCFRTNSTRGVVILALSESVSEADKPGAGAGARVDGASRKATKSLYSCVC